MKNVLPLLLCLLFGTYGLLAQPDIELELISSAFNDPVDIQNAGDDRLFIVEQGGLIRILNSDGTVNATPFLDISSQVSGGSEQGLLGLAFHPNYTNNGFFYVNYTDNGGDTQVSRFTVDPGDPDLALPGSEFPIIDYAQPFTNHNGGSIAFGSDGFLYISAGDGGSGGDPGNRAQDTTELLGKLLRIDVDNPSGGNNYGIPNDNPFAGDPVNAEEIWAYGLRNAWKFSFDSDTDEVWIADVGQADVEEINKQPGNAAGLNYGWRCYEGSQPFNTTGCPPPGALIFPEAEYSSSTGSGNCSVTGGYVYRGSMFPDLIGYYFAADVCSGRIFTVDSDGDLFDHGSFGGTWVSFGEDINNELYIADLSGEIYRVQGDPLIGYSDYDLSTFRMYPNPSSGDLLLAMESDLFETIKIQALTGSVVLEENSINKSEMRLDISNLQSGIYLVSVITIGEQLLTRKLVVE